MALPANNCASGQTPAQCNLAYHLGTVMRTNRVYAIYWIPAGYSVSANYESLIDRYFTDVAHDSGGSTNVYSTDTQYSDSTGSIAYHSTFGGSTVATNAFPASGCNDNVDSTCLDDQQIEAEIQTVIQGKGWPEDSTTMYFVMTPDGVGSCFLPGGITTSGQECTKGTTSGYCAYHNWFTDTGTLKEVVYANEPYNATIFGCNSGTSPNGDAADATINTISHEHNEAITDPSDGGWWNTASQQENGDNCAWVFGTALGTVGGQQYNQVINGHDYWLQEEWSNDGSACLQRYTPSSTPAVPVDLAPPLVAGIGAVGRTLSTSAGTWSPLPTGYAYKWQRCAADGTGCGDIAGATGASYRLAAGDVGHEVRSEVSAYNAAGSSGYTPSAPTEVVVPLPVASVLPVVSGFAGVGKTLSTTQGTWNTPVTYTYQWLRCTSAGSCSSVAGATAETYRMTPADTGHELEARVSATNAAGTTHAVSAPTAVVIGLPGASKLPHIAGWAKVGKHLRVRSGGWRGSPSHFRYQWLRCSAKGRSCLRIAHATRATYRVTKHDVRHRLRVRVTAVNAAGSTSSISSTTRVVRR